MTTKYYKCKLDKCLQCPVLKWSTRTLQQNCNKFWQIAKQPLICGGRVYWCKWCPRDYSRPKYWLRARDIRLAALEPSTAHLFLPQPPASPRHSSWQHLAVVNNKSPLHKNCHEERAADHLALWDLAQWWLEHWLGPYHDSQHAIHWSHPWRMHRSAECQVCPIRMVDCMHVLRGYRLCHRFDHMSNHARSSNDALECWTFEWSDISGSHWNFLAGCQWSLQALIKEQSRRADDTNGLRCLFALSRKTLRRLQTNQFRKVLKIRNSTKASLKKWRRFTLVTVFCTWQLPSHDLHTHYRTSLQANAAGWDQTGIAKLFHKMTSVRRYV